MNHSESLIDDYLKANRLDVALSLERTRSVIHLADARRRSRRKWLKLGAVTSTFCGVLCIGVMWYAGYFDLWKINQGQYFLGHINPRSFVFHKALIMVSVLAVIIGLALWLILGIGYWRRRWYLARVEIRKV